MGKHTIHKNEWIDVKSSYLRAMLFTFVQKWCEISEVYVFLRGEIFSIRWIFHEKSRFFLLFSLLWMKQALVATCDFNKANFVILLMIAMK